MKPARVLPPGSQRERQPTATIRSSPSSPQPAGLAPAVRRALSRYRNSPFPHSLAPAREQLVLNVQEIEYPSGHEITQIIE